MKIFDDNTQAKFSQRKFWITLLSVSLFTFLGMTLFEVLKQWIHPDIDIWESHFITIVFTTFIGTTAAYMALKRHYDLHKQITEELEKRLEAELKSHTLDKQLQESLTKVISGYLHICAECKKIQLDDSKDWTLIESYISKRSNAVFSHTVCPECAKKLYPQLKATQ